MATCIWCQTTRKLMVLDKYGRCGACQKAARYPCLPTRQYLGLDADGVLVRCGGRRTFPIGEFYPAKEDG